MITPVRINKAAHTQYLKTSIIGFNPTQIRFIDREKVDDEFVTINAKRSALRSSRQHESGGHQDVGDMDMIIADIEDEMTNESAGLGSRRQLITDGVAP